MDFPRSLPKYSSPLGSFPDYSLPGASALTSVMGWVITQNGGFSLILASNLSSALTIDDISQITSRSHTSLTNIGTLTHAQIDSYLDQSVKIASTPRFAGVGIGTAPSYPLHIVDAMTSTSDDHSAFIDLNLSGNDSGNVIHRGLYIDADSTFVGTDASGHRETIYGVDIDINIGAEGVPYLIRGIRSIINNYSTAAVTTVQNAGFFGSVVQDGTATFTQLNGNYIYSAIAGGTPTVTVGRGIWTWTGVAAAGATMDLGIGVLSQVIQSAGTLTLGYLFKGEYSGTVGTKWGIHLTDEIQNYLSGNLLIGTVTSLATLAKGLVFGTGTAPTAILANGVGLWCEDIAAGAGKSGLHMMSESGTEKLIVAGVVYKTDTGDPAQVHEGLMEINTFDNKVKMYADGAWRELGTW